MGVGLYAEQFIHEYIYSMYMPTFKLFPSVCASQILWKFVPNFGTTMSQWSDDRNRERAWTVCTGWTRPQSNSDIGCENNQTSSAQFWSWCAVVSAASKECHAMSVWCARSVGCRWLACRTDCSRRMKNVAVVAMIAWAMVCSASSVSDLWTERNWRSWKKQLHTKLSTWRFPVSCMSNITPRFHTVSSENTVESPIQRQMADWCCVVWRTEPDELSLLGFQVETIRCHLHSEP